MLAILEVSGIPTFEQLRPARDRLRAGLRDPLRAMQALSQRRSGIFMRLDQPVSGRRVHAGSRLDLSGWTFSKQGAIARIEIHLDDRLIATDRPDHERPDVAASYPGVPSARHSGFQGWITPRPEDVGERTLRITAIDENGSRRSVRLPIVVEAPPDRLADAPIRRSIVDDMPEGAVLFMHIPKTAGTSIRHLLDPLLPPETRLYLYPKSPSFAIPPDEFADQPRDARDRLRFVMGHFRFGIHEALDQPTQYITMVRDPIDRLISLYYHHKRLPRSLDHQRVTEGDLSFEEALQDRSLLPPNAMVRQIAGNTVPGKPSDRDLMDSALANIKAHFAAVLFMEDMPGSMARLSGVMGSELSDLPRKNSGMPRPARDAMDPSLLGRLREANQLDIELYERLRVMFHAGQGAAGGP